MSICNGSLIPGLSVSGPAHAEEHKQERTLVKELLPARQQRHSGMTQAEDTAHQCAVFPLQCASSRHINHTFPSPASPAIFVFRRVAQHGLRLARSLEVG